MAIYVMNQVVLVASVLLLRPSSKLAVVGFSRRVHLSIERSEKEVLKNGPVKNGFLVGGLCWLEAGEDFGELALVEKRVGDESLFLHEPAEDQARDEADNADVVVAVSFLGRVLREAGVLECPEVPVGDF